mgnify:CR=1 FL=1
MSYVGDLTQPCYLGDALVVLEARTPGQIGLRHPQSEKIVPCVHVPGQSASLLEQFRPYPT